MSIPEPKQALNGHCSAINDNTLYVFSPSGLQSLQLKENATWVEEESGTSVKGAACVKAAPGGDPALYVIGGESDDDGYSGLQRYFFGNKTWESLSPPGMDLSGRTNHSAAYLSDSQSILVYAGSTPEASSFLSSQTFLISVTEPYNIESFTSTAAPANQPILLPWSGREAVMTGGSPFSDVVYLFDRDGGWQQLGTNLSEPLDPGVRGTLIQGDDGSKVLETYDVSSSPNKVTQTVLLGAGGETAPNGRVLGQQQSSNKRKRDLTLENWPSYNSSNAPSATRSDYSVAQGSEGKVVLAGGNSDTPISMFDQNDNSWIDAGSFFNVKKMQNQEPLQPSTTADSTPSSTSSSEPEASTTAASGGGTSAHDKSMRTLGIVLGTLCGLAVVAILLLLYIRWRKSKKARVAIKNGDSEKRDENGNRLSFADRGASFMKEAGGSASDLPLPPQNRFDPNAPGSHSSLAIIGGKFNNKRNSALPQKGSFESTTHLVKDKDGGEPMEMTNIGEKKYLAPGAAAGGVPSLNVLSASPEDRRTSGWSKYFATSQPKDLEHMPAAYANDRDSVASQWPSTTATTAPSSSNPSRLPSSALVPPLDVDFSKTVDGQRLSNVISKSPSFADSREDLASRGSTIIEQKGMIEDGHRPVSDTNTVSSYDRSTMSSDFYNNNTNSVNSPWTPFSNDDQRPSSSVYTASIHDRRLPSRAARSQGSGFFPGAGATPRPTKLKINSEGKKSSESARGAGKDSPLLNSPPPIAALAPVHDRASTSTVFPHQEGDRWTANFSKSDLLSGDLAPPRAPGLMNSGPSAKPAADRDSTVTVFPMNDGDGTWTANSKNAQADDYELRPPGALGDARPGQDRDSTVTLFPRGVPSAYYANRPKEIDNQEAGKKPMNNDISWLNLGDNGDAGAGASKR